MRTTDQPKTEHKTKTRNPKTGKEEREGGRPGARGLEWTRIAVTTVAAVLLAVLPAGRAASAPTPDDQRAWPVTGPGGREPPTVVRGFEPPPLPWAPGHRGVDLAATAGTPVRAAAPGRVTFTGTVAGQGVVTVELSGTGTPPLRTTYEPVRATLPTGTQVTAGQPVGTLRPGPFHCPSGCLHWGLLRGDVYLDPLSLIPAEMRRHGPSRLLPVTGVGAPETSGVWGVALSAGVGSGARVGAAGAGAGGMSPVAAGAGRAGTGATVVGPVAAWVAAVAVLSVMAVGWRRREWCG
ncbi:M23 family metallopeptidase [Streptomyces sp. NPDC054933]